MKFIFYVIFFHFCFKAIISSFLNQEEIQISLDLVRELEIRQCVLVGDVQKEELISDFKEFSSASIPIIHFKYYPLPPYTDNTNPYFRTGLIFKEHTLKILEAISQQFEKVQKTHELKHFIWLINQTQNPQSNKLNIPYDCEFIVIQSENETTYKFTEIYTVKNKSFSLHFGTWDRNFGLKVSNASFYRRRSNFLKTEIRLITHEDEYSFTGNTGLMHTKEILSGLISMMNITSRQVNVSDHYSEIINIGDISTMFSAFIYDYYYFDTVGPIFKVIFGWYINYPRVESKPDYYIQPFDIYLWHVLLSFLVIGTALIMITQKWIQYKKRSLIDNLFLGLETFCNQCGNDYIETTSLRMIGICFRLIAIICVGLYGAVITSFFTVEIVRPPFTSLEEFLANEEYQLIADNKEYAEGILKMNQFSNNKTIDKKLIKIIESSSLEELVENICHGKYVSIGLNSAFPYKLSCPIFKIPKGFASIWNGLSIKKHSPFTKIFNENIVRFYEIGIQMRFGKMGNKAPSKNTIEDSFQPIKIQQMTQVLSMPFIGIFLGMIIFMIEIINKRRGFIRQKRHFAWKNLDVTSAKRPTKYWERRDEPGSQA